MLFSYIGIMENEFILQLENFISVLADVKQTEYNDYIAISVSKYETNIMDNNIYLDFCKWLTIKLKEKNYSEQQIDEFFKKDLRFIFQEGYDMKYKKWKNAFPLFDLILCCISIIGLILLPILLVDYNKKKSYNDIHTNIMAELKNSSSTENSLKIFDRYFNEMSNL